MPLQPSVIYTYFRIAPSWLLTGHSRRVFVKRSLGGKSVLSPYACTKDASSGTSGSFGVPAEKEDKRQGVELESLDNFALERWEVRS